MLHMKTVAIIFGSRLNRVITGLVHACNAQADGIGDLIGHLSPRFANYITSHG
jgi:hypothetical protein